MTRFYDGAYRIIPCDCLPPLGDPDLVAAWTVTQEYGAVRELLGTGKDGTPNGYLSSCESQLCGPHSLFDGASAYVDIGDTEQDVKTLVVILRPETNTESIVDLDGSASVEIGAGTVTATGWNSPTIYVDGLASTDAIARKWQHIVVTSDTAIDVDNLDLGRDGGNYFDGRIAALALFSEAKDAAWVAADYRRIASGGFVAGEGCRPSLATETADLLGGGSLPWRIESGSYQVQEDGERKKITTQTAGIISMPSGILGLVNTADAAFGGWHFTAQKADASTFSFAFVSTAPDVTTGSGYVMTWGADESVKISIIGGADVLTGGTASHSAEHRFDIVRRQDGEFEMWIDGVTIGTATEATHVVSDFLAVDSDANDELFWSDARGEFDAFYRSQGDYRPQ